MNRLLRFVDVDGELVFRRFPAPSTEDVAAIVKKVRQSVLRLLGTARISPGNDNDDSLDDPLAEEHPALAAACAASIQQMTAFGPRAGKRTRRLGEEPDEVEVQTKRKRHARYQGFDLHAGAPTKAEERDRLERMLRYLLRPPIAESRLRELPDGNILASMKSKWADGTTHLVFEPLELLERIAAIIPRPQINLVIYHGVLAPNAKWRSRVVAYKRHSVLDSDSERRDGACPRPQPPRYYAWAELMRRTFGYDVMACLKCGGRMRLLAMINKPDAIERILTHLELPTESPRALPARAPPEQLEFVDIDVPFEDTAIEY